MKEKKIEAVMLDRRCIKMKKIILLCSMLMIFNGCIVSNHVGCTYDYETEKWYRTVFRDGIIVGYRECK